MHDVTFIPVTEEHRNLLRRWASQPHWQQWWGEPEEELRLIYATEGGEHEPYIACVNDRPIAYVQAWWPSQHPGLAWQHGMPMTTRGIDISIGDEQDTGKGYGPLILRHFAAKLFAEGAARIVIDPELENDHAVSAYMKAGFTPYDTVEQTGGTVLLMELLPDDLDYGHTYT